jgi:hypothetical protein
MAYRTLTRTLIKGRKKPSLSMAIIECPQRTSACKHDRILHETIDKVTVTTQTPTYSTSLERSPRLTCSNGRLNPNSSQPGESHADVRRLPISANVYASVLDHILTIRIIKREEHG